MKTNNKEIMFWSETLDPNKLIGTSDQIPADKLKKVCQILRSGRVAARCRGYANCRICDLRLGSKDLKNDEFVWPERAEHYIEVHRVWIPELNFLTI